LSCLHGGIEEADRISPRILGLIERHVSLLHQDLGRLGLTTEERHANARSAEVFGVISTQD